jgi:Flp pilus assembly protein TadG
MANTSTEMTNAKLSGSRGSALKGLFERFRKAKRGNVLMLTGLSIIPLTSAVGISVDYARAARLQTKLNAAADAAVLAAVSQSSIKKTTAEAKTIATNLFNVQATGLNEVIYDPATLSVSVVDINGANTNRQATVTYTAQSKNFFGALLGKSTIVVGGTSKSNATVAPNIDFYLMLDTSPSMALPATSAGIATMKAKTGDCAFACHQTDVSGADTVVEGGVRMSYYSYARTQNLVLRTDLIPEAVKDLVEVAKTAATQNATTYRMALAHFDYTYHTLVAGPTNLDTVKSQVSNAVLLPYCRNNQRVCGTSDNDQATDFTGAFTGALAQLPATSGNGTNQAGDTPQAMLFIVTDGMRDENSSGRKMGPIPTSQCTTIKNRGVRIAILYTEYLPDSATGSWSITNVRTPYLDAPEKISPALLSCASPGLYYKVTTDGDISAALEALFRQAISQPRLLQ